MRHYLEVVAVMIVGMAVLEPVESAVLRPLGWQAVRNVPELHALITATT